MAANPGALRHHEHRLFWAVAILFPVVVLAGFARTYYLKFAFGTPPLASPLVHVHGLVMTAWVVFFISQVWLIRSKRPKTHMNAGLLGIALATLVIVVGFFTAAAGAKVGAASAPQDIPPLGFFVVPFMDLVLFAGFFGAAIYYRRNNANHKRLMLLTVLNFLPPAIARIPIDSLRALGPLWFFGVPTILGIGLITYDTWRHKKLNKVFLAGLIVLVASYPLRIMISGTEAWMSFAAWVTSWAA